MAYGRLGAPDLFRRCSDAPGLHEHLEDDEKIQVHAMQIDFIHDA